MKIIFLTGSINQGGAEFQLLSLAKLFTAKSINVEVLSLTDHDFYMPFIRDNKLNYESISNNLTKFQKIYRAYQFIINRKPDIVISYLRVPSIVAILIRVACLGKFKLFVGERTSLILPRYDLFYFNLTKLTNGLLTNSQPKLEYIKKRFPDMGKKAHFFPNIIDIDKFRPNSNQDILTKRNFVFVGRISPEKNVINLILAVETLLTAGYNLKLSLYGARKNENYFNQVNNLLEKSKFSNYIKYEGPSNNISKVYNNSSALCLISDYEGFSNAIAEAMSCGLPIIASNVPENKVLVEDCVNGFLVDKESVENIASGMAKFLEMNKEEIFLMSSINRKKAESMFKEEVIFENYIKLINDV